MFRPLFGRFRGIKVHKAKVTIAVSQIIQLGAQFCFSIFV